MSRRDLDVTRLRLERLAGAVTALLAHVEDLHGIAYERAGLGLDGGGRSGGLKSEANVAGNPRARAIYSEVVHAVAVADRRIGDARRLMLNLLSEGPASPGPSRGSLLRREEHEDLVARAEARGGPARLVPQPDHTGPSAKPKRKGKRK